MAIGTAEWQVGRGILRNVNSSRVALKHLFEVRKQMWYNGSCFVFIVEDNTSLWLLIGCEIKFYGCMSGHSMLEIKQGARGSTAY